LQYTVLSLLRFAFEYANRRVQVNQHCWKLNDTHQLVVYADDVNPYPTNVEKLGELLTVFQYTRISNKMQRHIVYLYLETALHVSGCTSTHHQKRIQLYLQHLVFVTTPLLLSAAVVEELEPA
jgi:hypothetical protein